jgi:four helix bundle protein
VKLVSACPPTVIDRRIGDQLQRSGTAAGANYEEARLAESELDFVHKLQIALKEMRESNYRLRLLLRAEVIPGGRLTPLLDESSAASCHTLKSGSDDKRCAKEVVVRRGGTESLLTFNV